MAESFIPFSIKIHEAQPHSNMRKPIIFEKYVACCLIFFPNVTPLYDITYSTARYSASQASLIYALRSKICTEERVSQLSQLGVGKGLLILYASFTAYSLCTKVLYLYYKQSS